MAVIDMGKPSEERIYTLPHNITIPFLRGSSNGVEARFRRKGEMGCDVAVPIITNTGKSVTVQLSTDLAKFGHGRYTLELIRNCDVCAEECIFLDYSCVTGDAEHEAPRKFKETCHCG